MSVIDIVKTDLYICYLDLRYQSYNESKTFLRKCIQIFQA